MFIRVSRTGWTSVLHEMSANGWRTTRRWYATQALVLVDLDERKACRIPDVARERIRAFEGDDVEL